MIKMITNKLPLLHVSCLPSLTFSGFVASTPADVAAVTVVTFAHLGGLEYQAVEVTALASATSFRKLL